MKRVVVYEDSADDIISRYGKIARLGHEVFVEFFRTSRHTIFSDGELLYGQRFTDAGFDVSKIRSCDVQNVPEADVYFVDGLQEAWHEVVCHLPRDKTYVASDISLIREYAVKQGYKVCRPDIDVQNIVENL